MSPFGFQDPIYGKDGKLIGYRVEAGQGPSQIAEDLNSLGIVNHEVNFQEIVASNPEKFTNVENTSDINDPGFRELNLNEGDEISLSEVLQIDSNIEDLEVIDNAITKVDSEIAEVTSDIAKQEGKADSVQKNIDIFTKTNLSGSAKSLGDHFARISESWGLLPRMEKNKNEFKSNAEKGKSRLSNLEGHKKSLTETRQILDDNINKYNK